MQVLSKRSLSVSLGFRFSYQYISSLLSWNSLWPEVSSTWAHGLSPMQSSSLYQRQLSSNLRGITAHGVESYGPSPSISVRRGWHISSIRSLSPSLFSNPTLGLARGIHYGVPVLNSNSSDDPDAAFSSSRNLKTSDDDTPAGSCTSESGQASKPIGKIIPRMAMVFTCVKCETRSVKTFNRSSYEKGVVLVRCPGCDKQHLVADHLGWFGDRGFDIEQLRETAGIRVDVVGSDSSTNPSATNQLNEPSALSAELVAGWSRVQSLVQELKHGERRDELKDVKRGDDSSKGTFNSSSDHEGSDDVSALRSIVQEVDGVLEITQRDEGKLVEPEGLNQRV